MPPASAVEGGTWVPLLEPSQAPAEAQRDYEPLHDQFNFQIELSWVNISSEIWLDSEILGTGSTLAFQGRSPNDTEPASADKTSIAPRRRMWKMNSIGETRSYPWMPFSI